VTYNLEKIRVKFFSTDNSDLSVIEKEINSFIDAIEAKGSEVLDIQFFTVPISTKQETIIPGDGKVVNTIRTTAMVKYII